MKIALSSAAFLERDFSSVVAAVRASGCEGVDVGTVMVGAVVAKPDESRKAAAEAGVEICCIECPVEFMGQEQRDLDSAEQVRKLIDAAGKISCPFVQVGADANLLGRSAMTMPLGDWLAPLGGFAFKNGVSVLLVNRKAFGASRDIWAVLDRLQHPAIGCCWDLSVGAERPGVSVPTLNSRIRLTRIGEADATAEQFIKRLRGIGYDGYVVVNSVESAQRVRSWMAEGKTKTPTGKKAGV